MNYQKKSLKSLLLLALVAVFFTQCNKDDDGTNPQGSVQFEMTDGPIDDANVEGVFVTVTQVKVDGEVVESFDGPQTIDVKAYQQGNTKVLGLSDFDAGTYSNISLVLDYETDASGNSPGCYVLTTDNTRHALNSTTETSTELVSTKSFAVNENSRTDIVLDFDLRKAVKYDDGNANSDYSFVTNAELEQSVRAVVKANAGTVEGNCSDSATSSDLIVVYAYSAGTFNRTAEMQGQGESNIEFKNAVSSAIVDAQGSYNLSFLEDGEYELVFAAYEENTTNNRMELQGTLTLDVLLGLNLNSINVDANSSTTVDVVVTGIVPF